MMVRVIWIGHILGAFWLGACFCCDGDSRGCREEVSVLDRDSWVDINCFCLQTVLEGAGRSFACDHLSHLGCSGNHHLLELKHCVVQVVCFVV